MPRSQDPPRPDLSKTFWTPEFPSHQKSAVRREHPILRWGDCSSVTGLYFWQNRRCEDSVTATYHSKIKRALTGMWYGVENNPRCNRCKEKDRNCTRVTNDPHGGAACARCRINPERNCSFARGGRRDLGRKRRRLVVQDDSEDDLPVKTILSRRRTNDKHDANTTETRPNTIEIPESPTSSSLFCTPSETTPASRPTTPPGDDARLFEDNSKSVFGETARGGHRSRGNYYGAQDYTEGPPINAPKGPKAMREDFSNVNIQTRGSYPGGGYTACGVSTSETNRIDAPSPADDFEERLRAVKAEINRNRAEQRLDRDRIVKLEEQITRLKEQQDRKLEQEIRGVRAAMNHAVNQTLKR